MFHVDSIQRRFEELPPGRSRSTVEVRTGSPGVEIDKKT
jgi:hypothetical protein